jgi:hypothetical protein
MLGYPKASLADTDHVLKDAREIDTDLLLPVWCVISAVPSRPP